MNIKFILLMIGIFLFTLGYVNQNKYNCNIVPSLNKIQEQDLRNLFYKDNEFLKREPDNKIYDWNISDDSDKYSKVVSSEYREAQYLTDDIDDIISGISNFSSNS